MVSVDVWSAPLDLADADWTTLERTLDADERAQARRIIDPLQRWRWVADHGWRRTLLARLLDRAPREIGFTLNEHGRPDVTGARLSFNASRGGAVAVYAASWDAVVGVDVEPLGSDVELEPFARRFFTADERAALASLPNDQQQAGCCACWTRKEAYAKAIGTGLVFPLTEVEVWAGDDRTVRFGECEIQTLAVGDGLAASLAVAGHTSDAPRQVQVRPLTKLSGTSRSLL